MTDQAALGSDAQAAPLSVATPPAKTAHDRLNRLRPERPTGASPRAGRGQGCEQDRQIRRPLEAPGRASLGRRPEDGGRA